MFCFRHVIFVVSNFIGCGNDLINVARICKSIRLNKKTVPLTGQNGTVFFCGYTKEADGPAGRESCKGSDLISLSGYAPSAFFLYS